jgi:probable phosphoglycerate mutase
MDDQPILADGHPWMLAEIFASEGKSLRDPDWRLREPFCRSKVIDSASTVIEGIDMWLEELGYKREGEYYRVVGTNTSKSVAMFSHGGASEVALSHLFNIPFPQICGMLHIELTGVTVVSLSNRYGELVYPKLISSDATHIIGLEAETVYGN